MPDFETKTETRNEEKLRAEVKLLRKALQEIMKHEATFAKRGGSNTHTWLLAEKALRSNGTTR